MPQFQEILLVFFPGRVYSMAIHFSRKGKKMLKFVFMMLAALLPAVMLAESKVIDVAKVDKNFAEVKVQDRLVRYYDALDNPAFVVEGFPWRNGRELLRVPGELLKDKLPNLATLARCTAGGAIRFRTNSKYVAVKVEGIFADMNHMPRNGSAGVDIYEFANGKWTFRGVTGPKSNDVYKTRCYEGLIRRWGNGQMREFMINLPLYSRVTSVQIGLEPSAAFEKPLTWKIAKPILFYGSSITQGGCASHPGNNYPSILCRELSVEQINLGFSGNAKGEPALAEAIAKLDLAAFVMDYDHNAPNAEHLQKTHAEFFRIIRQANPKLPILLLTRGDGPSPARTAVIKATYDAAVKAGDKHVYFIDGKEYFAHLPDPGLALVDGCHPSDFGFYLMYEKVLPVLKKALAEAE